MAEVGEHALIQRITARLAIPPWVEVGPGDDAAVVRPARGAWDVFTIDAQVEGIHFDRRFVPSDAIGHRALAVNLSDLAAMGAEPRAALLSMALPGSLAIGVVDGIVDGLVALADTSRVAIVGGNISRSPGPMFIDVTAIGSVRPRRVLTRGAARPGDDIYVTGELGQAAIGLRVLQDDSGSALHRADPGASGFAAAVQRYLRPEARVRAGLLLGRNRAASGCVDLSDGLADGLRQIASAAGVGAVIDVAALPIGVDVRLWHERFGGDAVQTACTGGDDYELLFTVRPSQRGRLRAVRRQLGVLPIHRIGVVTRDSRLLLRDERGVRDLPAGYEHFRAS